jgi:hypothetical protein
MKKRLLYQICDRDWSDMFRKRERERRIGESKLFNELCNFASKILHSPKALSLNSHTEWIFFGDSVNRGIEKNDTSQVLIYTKSKTLKRSVVIPKVWTPFVNSCMSVYSSIVHKSTVADCVCWTSSYGGAKYFTPIRSSEICCRNVAKMTNGGFVKMETWGKFFIDCLLKTAPYGIIEYTPKRWFPPICEKGDYFDPVLTDEEIAKHEQLSKQWKSEEERVSILLGLPLDVVNESPDGE